MVHNRRPVKLPHRKIAKMEHADHGNRFRREFAGKIARFPQRPIEAPPSARARAFLDWETACGYTSYMQAALALGVANENYRQYRNAYRKPRITIPLAMTAILEQLAPWEVTPEKVREWEANTGLTTIAKASKAIGIDRNTYGWIRRGSQPRPYVLLAMAALAAGLEPYDIGPEPNYYTKKKIEERRS